MSDSNLDLEVKTVSVSELCDFIKGIDFDKKNEEFKEFNIKDEFFEKNKNDFNSLKKKLKELNKERDEYLKKIENDGKPLLEKTKTLTEEKRRKLAQLIHLIFNERKEEAEAVYEELKQTIPEDILNEIKQSSSEESKSKSDYFKKEYSNIKGEMDKSEESFLSDKNGHSLFWELVIGCFFQEKMKDKGDIKRPKIANGAPDFLFTTKENKKVWIECVACGINEREIPKMPVYDLLDNSKDNRPFFKTHEEFDAGFADSIAEGNTLLAYYNVIKKKEKQAKERIEKQIISKDDFNILCVNGYEGVGKILLGNVNQRSVFYQLSVLMQHCEHKYKYIELNGKKVYIFDFYNFALKCFMNVLWGDICPKRDINICGKNMIICSPYIKSYLSKNDGSIIIDKQDFVNNSRTYFDDLSDEEKENYLPIDFFFRDDFPFNGVLFSNVNFFGKKTDVDYLVYFQNPKKPSCVDLFKDVKEVVCIEDEIIV